MYGKKEKRKHLSMARRNKDEEIENSESRLFKKLNPVLMFSFLFGI